MGITLNIHAILGIDSIYFTPDRGFVEARV